MYTEVVPLVLDISMVVEGQMVGQEVTVFPTVFLMAAPRAVWLLPRIGLNPRDLKDL